MITVRLARQADVPGMSRLLIASITELCGADHAGDPQAIAAWTANKTAAGVGKILANPDEQMLVAEHDGALAAVGSASNAGSVTLLYVHPAHRFKGASKALLAALEVGLREADVRVAKLKSTATAHRFYLASGWVDDGPAAAGRFITSRPMRKIL